MQHPMMPNAQENAYRLAAVVMTMAMTNIPPATPDAGFT